MRQLIMSLLIWIYRKNSKNWDTWNNYHNCPTIGTVGFYRAVLCSKDTDRITNREDPDQTAPWGAVWSGSALFAQTYLSQYLKLLRYTVYPQVFEFSTVYSLDERLLEVWRCDFCRLLFGSSRVKPENFKKVSAYVTAWKFLQVIHMSHLLPFTWGMKQSKLIIN